LTQDPGPSPPRLGAIQVLAGFIALLWIVEIVDVAILSDRLEAHGIGPRRLDGLEGVLTAPFLHDDFGHLLANTIPLVVLGGLVLVAGIQRFAQVLVIVTIGAGVLIWLLARGGNHIGASILVFGFFGYLLGRGYFERSVGAIVVAVIVALVYGGLFWGLLPIRPGVSWEGHLFGLLAGIAAAALLSRRRTAPATKE